MYIIKKYKNKKFVLFINFILILSMLVTSSLGSTVLASEGKKNKFPQLNSISYAAKEKGILLNKGLACKQDEYVYFANISDDSSYLYKKEENGEWWTKLAGLSIEYVTVEGEWVYFISENNSNLYKIKIDGTEMQLLCNYGVKNINVAGDWIYFLDKSTNQLRRIKSDGSQDTTLTNYPCSNIQIVGEDVYFINCNDRRIYKSNIEGQVRNELVDTKMESYDYVQEFYVQAEWIYYKYSGMLYRIKLDGTDNKRIIWSVDKNIIKGDWVYYINSNDYLLYKINVDGTGNTKLNNQKIGYFNIKDEYIYCYAYNDKQIVQIKTDGTSQKVLVNNFDNEGNVSITDDWLYYIDYNSPVYQLKRIKTDGTSDEVVHTKTSMAISEKNITLKENEAKQLYAINYPQGVNVDDAVWTTDNPNVAVVDENGVVRAVSEGEAFIKVQSNKLAYMDFCKVIVVPLEDTGLGNTPGNLLNKGYICQKDDYIYFDNITSQSNKLFKKRTDGSEIQRLSNDNVSSININGDWIYYINDDSNASLKGKVYKIKTDGTGKEEIIGLIANEMCVKNNWIYYFNTSGIYKASIDGKQNIKLSSDVSKSLNIIGSYIYYVDSTNYWTKKICRIGIDGQNKKELGVASTDKMIVYEDWIYYDDYSENHQLYRMRIDGSNKSKLAVNNIESFNIKDGWIYYSNNGGLRKMKIDSTEPQTVAEVYLHYINLVDDFIYFKKYDSNKYEDQLLRMKNDGTACEVISVEDYSIDYVDINLKEINLYENQSEQLTAEIFPKDVKDKEVKWSSSDNNIATVDANGVVVAGKEGQAIITVTTKYGSKMDTCVVNVKSCDGVILLNKTMMSIVEGKTEQLTAAILSGDTQNKSTLWTCSNEQVAKVDDSGLVTAISEGEAIVTCALEGTDKKAICIIKVGALMEYNKIGNSNGNINNYGYVCEKDGWVYFANHINGESKLCKVKEDGSKWTKLSDANVESINVVGNWIYYKNLSDDNRIYKIKTNGSENQKISYYSCAKLIVYGDYLYYTSSSDGYSLYKVAVNSGGAGTKIIDEQIFEFNLLDEYIYYNSRYDKKFYKVKIDGTNKTKISDIDVNNFVIDNEWIYYSNFTQDGYLFKMKLDGTENTRLTQYYTDNTNVKDDWIYLIKGRKLYKIKNDGTGCSKICDDDLTSINIIGDWVYYINSSDNYKLYKIKADGSQRQEINYFTLEDLKILSEYYGTKLGDEKYKPQYDLNGDGVIDIFDLVILSKKVR